jgi:hypothetical protein
MDREIKLKVTKSCSNTINKRQSPSYQFERKYIWDFAEIGAGQETDIFLDLVVHLVQ